MPDEARLHWLRHDRNPIDRDAYWLHHLALLVHRHSIPPREKNREYSSLWRIKNPPPNGDGWRGLWRRHYESVRFSYLPLRIPGSWCSLKEPWTSHAFLVSSDHHFFQSLISPPRYLLFFFFVIFSFFPLLPVQAKTLGNFLDDTSRPDPVLPGCNP